MSTAVPILKKTNNI